jgi:pSer/pThr/pTyr-binding forkhead associated (FHA) protein
MAKLVIFEEIENEEPVTETFDLSAHQILIGSGPDNDLVLEAPDIDPTHASLELRQQYWVLQDLGGPGGTVVNGIEIQGPFQLHHGDLIELNQVKLRFEDDDAPEEPQEHPKEESTESENEPVRGRVWFASVAGTTLVVIVIILLLLVLADFLGLMEVADLLPVWFQ